jgi:glycosidase
MPSVVMMAKNSYVWLYQLSRKYGRAITRLDEIPDEELDFLAGAGFTGLWLIGLWQRSKASERIKKLCGNPEAVASAYSIHSYQIADDLGGEAAFNNLRDRAWRRGIRMASDMVPNHFGIESDWVLYQPDKFLSLDYSPYPSYTFNGENLSPDPAIGIFLEDHYYSRTDAAVVFKRVDYHTGDTRYIYHGNDGTVMPWNDTAQLNYLRADVREAVIQIILDVARRTPIIRFDAAMTLAKKHIQRLWFPEPGSGGAIPSRAEHSLSRAEFDRLLPEEFWREVVDRVAREVPDTLLLAEAFWLMEGYFVRTLGMHRVYNSAFMHMLRNEDNANFRKLIKNTLEFDPEILKRYVNFMNNPDEKTAAEQFGDGDKYFGVCTVLATLPGLPMFGHGQLEGFSEKYGMEYRRAYMDEQVNEGLLNHHRKIIFPLIRQRAQFSGAAGFRLYDFYTQNGSVNDDVIAYTNEHFGRKSLVLFHNKYQNTAGWINISSPYLKKDNGATALQTESLASALGCSGLPGHYVIFREAATGLTYIRESQDIARSGWYAELSGYGHRVYQDFYEVADTKDAPYAELCRTLAGRGVPDLNRELRKIRIQDFYQTLAALLKPEVLRQVQAALITGGPAIEKLIQDNQSSLAKFSWHYHDLYPDNYSGREFSEVMNQSMIALADFQRFAQTLPGDSTGREIARQWNSLIAGDALPAIWLRVLAGSIHLTTKNQSAGLADYFDDWLLKSLLEDDPANLRKASWFFLTPELTRAASNSPAAYFAGAVGSAILPRELGFNLANNHLWFNQEAMQSWLELLPVTNYLALLTQPDLDANQKLEMIQQTVTLTRQLQAAFRQSDCMVEKMTRILNEPVTTQADKRSVP